MFTPQIIPRSVTNLEFGLRQSPAIRVSQKGGVFPPILPPFATLKPRELSRGSKFQVCDRYYSINSHSDKQSLSKEESILKEILKLNEKEKPKSHSLTNSKLYFTPVTKKLSLNPDSKHPFAKRTVEILTGCLKAHPIPKNASSKLRANLESARKIINLLNKLVPFSYNHLQRSRIFSEKSYDKNSEIIVFKALSLTRKKISEFKPIRYNVRKILKYKTGNCDELALVGLFIEKNAIKVEISPGDHIFLILGHNKDLSLDYKHLEPGAVVCCPWTGSYYPASKLKKYLLDYVGPRKFDERLYAQVMHFNPAKQTLKHY